MRHWTVTVVVAYTHLIGGCFSKARVPQNQLYLLHRAQQTRELIVRAKSGKRIRIGPNTRVRFKLVKGTYTPWISGRKLRANPEGVCGVKGCKPHQDGWLWADITSAQIKYLSGGKTYVAIIAITVATAALLAAGVATGGRGRIGLFRVAGSGGPRVGVGRGIGGRAGALRGLGRVTARVADAAITSHLTSSSSADPMKPAAVSPKHPIPPPQPPAPESVPTARAHLVFNATIRRRAIVRFIGSVEGGTDLLLLDGMNTGAFVGLRLFDAFELAGGARMMLHRGQHDPAHPQKLRDSWMGVFRIGAHLDLDARRRFALPFSIDLGGGQATFYAKLNLGLRVRVSRRLWLGIYPFNPTFASFEDKALKRKNGWWSFPTNIDLGFAF